MATKRMSWKTFLTKLRRLRNQFRVEDTGLLRTTVAYVPAGCTTARSLCPIEAVARLLGEPIDDQSLKLDKRVRERLLNAADDSASVGRTLRFRRQMLKAVRVREA